MTDRYDLVVIGSGPAGQKAAIAAAKLGRRSAVVERRDMVGGVCINTGTIPSKTLREAVLYLTGMNQRELYGSAYRVKDDITVADLSARTHHVIAREIDVIRNQLSRNRVAMIPGTARFMDPFTLEVENEAGITQEVVADKFVIAVGTRPARPASVDFDGETIVDSDQILNMNKVPASMVVVGAGVIGIEYASMFAALGTKVTVVEKRPQDAGVLRRGDRGGAEVSAAGPGGDVPVRRIGAHRRTARTRDADHPGVGQEVPGRDGSVFRRTAGCFGHLARRGGRDRDRPIVAGWRSTRISRPRSSTSTRWVTSSGFPRWRPPRWSRAGGRRTTPSASRSAASLGDLQPIGIYSIPEISYVGHSEAELTGSNIPYEVGVSRYRELARGAILGDSYGVLKLLVHAETRQLLGVHVFGSNATELVHIGQTVMGLGGTVDYLVDAVFNYPTLAESYKVAALDAVNKMRAIARVSQEAPMAEVRERVELPVGARA